MICRRARDGRLPAAKQGRQMAKWPIRDTTERCGRSLQAHQPRRPLGCLIRRMHPPFRRPAQPMTSLFPGDLWIEAVEGSARQMAKWPIRQPSGEIVVAAEEPTRSWPVGCLKSTDATPFRRPTHSPDPVVSRQFVGQSSPRRRSPNGQVANWERSTSRVTPERIAEQGATTVASRAPSG